MSATKKVMQHVRNNPLPWLVQAFATVFFIGNLYMATQLFPLIRDIDGLISKVSAIEKRNQSVDLIVPRFIVVEEKTLQAEKDRIGIKDSLNRIEAKIDNIIQRL